MKDGSQRRGESRRSCWGDRSICGHANKHYLFEAPVSGDRAGLAKRVNQVTDLVGDGRAVSYALALTESLGWAMEIYQLVLPTGPTGRTPITLSWSFPGPTRCPVTCARCWLLSLKIWITAALGLALLGRALPANAGEEGEFTLSWQAPADCPSPGDVRGEVVRLLGGPVRLPAGRGFKASAQVAHAQTWSVSIETELAGRAGRRAIEAASCQDLADATAMILALAIDPSIAATLPAQEDLRAGLPARALRRLAEYDRRFGKGALAEERRAIAAIALCSVRPGPAARAQSERFLQSAPDSPLAGRVRAACEKSSETEK